MELRQLKYFIRIVELGSLSRAATDLYIAQPALSQQISSLEAELEVRLLARSARGVAPTDAGLRFYRHAQLVLRQLERLRAEVRDTCDGPSGLVTVGIPRSIANLLAEPLIRTTQQRFPKIQLRIQEGASGYLEELVATARIEMSLLYDRSATTDASKSARPKTGTYLRVQPLLEEEYMLFSAGQQLQAAPITLEQAAQLSFVLPGAGNTTRQMIEEIWQRAGYRLNVLAELDSIPTIKNLVASGVAATILSPAALTVSQNEGLTVRRIEGADLKHRVSLCTYDVVALGTAAQEVMKLIAELTHKLVTDGCWLGASVLPIEDITEAAPA